MVSNSFVNTIQGSKALHAKYLYELFTNITNSFIYIYINTLLLKQCHKVEYPEGDPQDCDCKNRFLFCLVQTQILLT